MTSKNSWFSHQLLWDTFRKNLWLAALSFLTFFFSLPVATALILQQYQQDVANGYREETFARTVNEVMQPFSQSHPFVVFFIILGAVIAGTAVFYYLHNRQRTDFYHSLPLSRTKLFTINYTAGALLVLLPYVINILFTLIVVAANGYFGYLNGLEVLGNACHHILFFFAVYSLAVLAAMLTGNWVTNLLLTGVLSTIFPVFLGLYELGMQCFYATYYNASDLLLKLACWLSPVTRYITANGDVAPGVNIQNWEYGVWILVVLLLTAAALLLYRKRPSESAGHAIAFNWAKPIIKYPLILMFTLLVGFIFHSIGDDDSYQQWGWLIFGFVCGGLIISRIAEIVFAFDFKAIKSNWKGLIVFAVVFAVFISVPLFDLTGYDSYLPELKDVKAVNITTSGIDNLDQHDYYLYADFHGGSYDEAFYATTLLEEPENIQKALEIAALSLQDSQMEEDASLSDQASWFNDDLYTYTTVVYTLQSGRKVGRTYNQVESALIQDLYLEICNTQEYKENRYSSFYLPAENLVFSGINVFSDSSSRGFEFRQFNQEQYAALVEAFRQDLLATDSQELQSSFPVGSISFDILQKNTAELWDKNTDEIRQFWSNTVTYPLYSSFTNTWNCLTQIAGIDESAFRLTADQIEKIEVVDLVEEGAADQEFTTTTALGSPAAAEMEATTYDVATEVTETVETVTDPQQMAALLVNAYPEDAFYYSAFRWHAPNESHYLRVYPLNRNGNYVNYYYPL